MPESAKGAKNCMFWFVVIMTVVLLSIGVVFFLSGIPSMMLAMVIASAGFWSMFVMFSSIQRKYPEFGEQLTPEVTERVAHLSEQQKRQEAHLVVRHAMRRVDCTPGELVEFETLVRRFYEHPETFHQFPSIDDVRHAK